MPLAIAFSFAIALALILLFCSLVIARVRVASDAASNAAVALAGVASVVVASFAAPTAVGDDAPLLCVCHYIYGTNMQHAFVSIQ